MKLRKIKTGLFTATAFAYRLTVIIIQSLVFLALTGDWKISVGGSIAWNIINMAWYFIYHYYILRLFKFGKNYDYNR
jgi:hypothetical protein